jgi:hypothetical protein
MIQANAVGLSMNKEPLILTGNAHAKTDAEQMVCGALVMQLMFNL